MKKRRLIIVMLAIVLTAVGIGGAVLYKLGDKVFDDVIDGQIAELEKGMEQPAPEVQTPVTAAEPAKKVTIEVTKEKLETIKKAVTPADKVTAAKIILSELNKSDINQLTKLSSGGITAEEKADIKSIITSRLTQQEIEEVKAMYYKYMK